MEYRGSLQLSGRRQGGVDAFDGSELRFPERLRFHFFQVGVGIAEIRPDVFLVGEEAFLFGARAHVQDVHFAAAAEYALEPATELGGIHGAKLRGWFESVFRGAWRHPWGRDARRGRPTRKDSGRSRRWHW